MNRRMEIPEEHQTLLANTLTAMDQALKVASAQGERAMVVVHILEREVAVELVPIKKVLRSGTVKTSRVMIWSVDGRPCADQYVTNLVFRPKQNNGRMPS